VNAPNETPTLVVEDLHTSFATARGALKAVDGVSFTLRSGRTLGVVGESGSGKSATARSIMNLLPPGVSTTTGRVLLDGRDIRNLPRSESRHVWGVEASMVFQNPMTSLNPVIQVGRQIGEGLRYHRKLSREAAGRRARELLPLLVSGALVREGGDRLLRRFPGKQHLLRVSLAGVWTFLAGQIAVRYFEEMRRHTQRLGGGDAGEAHVGPHRQVEAADGDGEHLADRHHQQDPRLAGNVPHVVHRGVDGRLDEREDEDQQPQAHQQLQLGGVLGGPVAQREPVAPRGRRRGAPGRRIVSHRGPDRACSPSTITLRPPARPPAAS